MKKRIQLSDHFNYGRLLRFTMPSILMMIFTSIYGMVDGFFVSNYAGKTAFAALNIIYPYLMILGGVGAMLGVGGSALVAKTLGEGDVPRSQRYFSMMIILMVITSVVCTLVGIATLRPVAYIFGATEHMMPDVMRYGIICLIFNTALQAQYTFQSYLIVAERPQFALWVVVAAGVTNMVLDFLFIVVMDMGIAGAAWATGISQLVAGVIPFVWFISKRNTSDLRFTRTKLEWKPMITACVNGSSEMLSSVSASITGIMYNWQLMHYAGEDGVAAYGVVMYAGLVFFGVFVGYSQGCSPIMGYHYGAGNHREMKSVLRRSMVILAASGVVLTAISMVLARPISSIFVGYDEALLDMTTRGFIICNIPFLFMWFNIYVSSFFTALNDGPVSAAISFMRALVLPVVCIIFMPMIWKLDGIWYSLTGSEFLALAVAAWYLWSRRKKYNY